MILSNFQLSMGSFENQVHQTLRTQSLTLPLRSSCLPAGRCAFAVQIQFGQECDFYYSKGSHEINLKVPPNHEGIVLPHFPDIFLLFCLHFS